MVRLVKISKASLIKYVSVAYENDLDLFSKYHIGEMDFMGCVFSTMNMIREMAIEKELRYYKVINDKMPIGYMVEFDGFLYSYGINIKFRKKDILIAWWSEVKKIMGTKFVTMLYHNNERAIKFLEKNGMVAMPMDEQNKTIVLVYNPSLNKLKPV